MSEVVYKLSDAQDRTRTGKENECQWGEGVTHVPARLDTPPELCTASVVHAYQSPLLATLLNPAHGDYAEPRCWESEADVVLRAPDKLGCSTLTTIRRVELPVVTTVQRTRFAILAAKAILPHDTEGQRAWHSWADRWLSGKDRSAEAARSAVWAAEAARSAAWAAEVVWAEVASRAAEAARSAAWAAMWAAEAARSAAWAAVWAAEVAAGSAVWAAEAARSAAWAAVWAAEVAAGSAVWAAMWAAEVASRAAARSAADLNLQALAEQAIREEPDADPLPSELMAAVLVRVRTHPPLNRRMSVETLRRHVFCPLCRCQKSDQLDVPNREQDSCEDGHCVCHVGKP